LKISVFPCGNESEVGEGGRRTLLGDNTSGHDVAYVLPGCKSLNFNWAPFYIGIFDHRKKVKEVILVNDQIDALFVNVFISCLHMFRATSAHHQEGS
jgi:hypothetical protein